MIRVLAAIIVPPHLSVSGGARAGEQLSSALSAYCDITVASMMNGANDLGPARPRSFQRANVRSHLPPIVPWSRLPNHLRTLFYRSAIPELVLNRQFDIVHIHNPLPALEMERVARACKVSGTPYVVSTHGFNEVAHGEDVYGFDLIRKTVWRRLVRAPVQRVVQGADAIFMLSPADEPIVRQMGYDGNDLSIVSNGVPAPVETNPDAIAAVCRRIGISPVRQPGQITCMFLANHTPNKGLPILLKTFASLSIPYLLIIGGEPRDGIDYERAMKTCGPDQRIVVTGRLGADEIAPLYSRSDLFVFPTLADTFPLVILEAMSYGLPVIASQVGGIPHQVDESCGLLVPPGDPEALASSIRDLARDPERRARLGTAARQKVLSEFTWERAAKQAALGYARVLERRGLTSRTQPFSVGHGVNESWQNLSAREQASTFKELDESAAPHERHE